MKRFDIRTDDRYGWALKKRDDGLGMFVFAEEAIGFRTQYHMTMVALIAVCTVFAAYLVFHKLVFHKHDPQPVQKVSEEEYRQVLQEVEQLRASKVADQRKIADILAIRKNYEAQLKTQNANNAKLVQQLKEVQASVPPLPVIQEALRKEAATDAGFKAAVARNFGREIAGRIEVRP